MRLFETFLLRHLEMDIAGKVVDLLESQKRSQIYHPFEIFLFGLQNEASKI